jgi:probable phosphoglycerate mutase
MTQVVLIRHAETTMISAGRIHGRLDAPLTEIGIRDSRRTADLFRGQSFDVLYASSLGRAVRTAEIIGEAINLKPIPVEQLQERYYGWLEGKSLSRFEPDGSGDWYLRPYVQFALWVSGESEKQVADRVAKCITGIIADHQNQRIMLVVHWGVLNILYRYFRGEDVYDYREAGPWTACGVTEFHSNGNGWKTVRINDGSFLKNNR